LPEARSWRPRGWLRQNPAQLNLVLQSLQASSIDDMAHRPLP
jgi:hypothetical protein